MKKLLLLVAAIALTVTLSACSGAKTYEVAMITDSGLIDDESFNQGTWEGIVAFCEENDLTHKYYKPSEVSDDAYLDAIELAIEGGAKIVVTPGFLFETSVHAAQTKFPETKFIIIDGAPHNVINWGTMATYDDAAPDFTIASNTMSIFFNENESGFLAGYAAVKDGNTKLGFTGGMAVPAVVKFGIGFVAGAFYAAEEDSVAIELGDATYTYFGDFAPSDAYKNVANTWYAGGTEVIFAAAGGAGASVIAAAADNSALMIGVDVDQSGQSDTVLTSAMKGLGEAVQQGLQTYVDGTFSGGDKTYKGASNDGVALPMATSIFTTFSVAQYDAVYAKIVAGTIVVPTDYATLVTFLGDATGYPTQAVIEGTN